MPEVLSQSQIDDLLAGMRAGKANLEQIEHKPKKNVVKNYDFRTPKKCTKEQLRTLSSVFDTFARHLTSYFTGTMRSNCKIELASIEETRYHEYSIALPESTLYGLYDLSPLEGSVLLQFSKHVIYTVIEKLLGGYGKNPIVDREYTEIELVLMQRIYKQLMPYFKESFSQVVDIDPSFVRLETNNLLTQIMPMDEVVIVVMFTVKLIETTSAISVCLPYITIEKIVDKLNLKYQMSIRPKSEAEIELSRNYVIEQLKNSPIEIVANLGDTELRLEDLMKIQVGDVIKLDQPVKNLLPVTIGDNVWFYAELGTRKNKLALRIKSIV